MRRWLSILIFILFPVTFTAQSIRGYDSLGISLFSHGGISCETKSQTCGYYLDIGSIHIKRGLLYFKLSAFEAEWLIEAPEITGGAEEFYRGWKDSYGKMEGGLILFNTGRWYFTLYLLNFSTTSLKGIFS